MPFPYEPGINKILFTPDGKRLISGGSDRCIRLWNPKTGELINAFEEKTYLWIDALAITHDGRYLFSNDDAETVSCWDMTSQRRLRTITVRGTYVKDLAITPDGKYLIVGSDGYDEAHIEAWSQNSDGDWQLATIQMWSVERLTKPQGWLSKKILGETLYGDDYISGYYEGVERIAISPDGQWLAAGHLYSSTTDLWHWPSKRKEGRYQKIKAPYAFTKDSRYLIGCDDAYFGGLTAWDLQEQRAAYVLQSCDPLDLRIPFSQLVAMRPFEIATSPCGQFVAATTKHEKFVRLWHVPTKRMTSFTADSRINCCTFSPDSSVLAAADEMGKVHLLAITNA